MRYHSLVHLLVLWLALSTLSACQPVVPPEVDAAWDAAQRSLGAQAAAVLDEPDVAAADPLFVTLFPDLRGAPSPEWLRVGTRVTYNFGYATFADDPEETKPSGSGLIQYDVLIQNLRMVVTVPTLISTQIQGQPPTALPHQIGLPGVGEFWFAPDVLAGAVDVQAEGFAAARLTTKVAGTSYDVVRFRSKTEKGEEVWAFEVDTGLLVFYRSALYDNDGKQSGGNYLTLIGQRRVQPPWSGGSVPEWVTRRATMELTGSQLYDVGGPPSTSLPVTVSTQFTRIRPAWSEYAQTTYVNGMETAAIIGATGARMIFGGLWLPPEALGVLKKGDVLDQDPYSGIETRVERANATKIVLQAKGPNHLTRLTYGARDGRLVAYYQEAHMQAVTIFTELVAP